VLADCCFGAALLTALQPLLLYGADRAVKALIGSAPSQSLRASLLSLP
jgi:hypothetical protein